jgi:hypothetical protein
MASRPYAAKSEALAQLAVNPVMRELRGHPKAIVMFAPLLEGNRLESLGEAAQRCYKAAIKKPDDESKDDGGPRLFFKDASCEKLWTEVSASPWYADQLSQWSDSGCCGGWQLTTTGHRRSSSLVGVPWYNLANALQQQLRDVLVASTQRHAAHRSGGAAEAGPVGTGVEGEGGAEGGAEGDALAPGQGIRGLSETDIQSLRSKLVGAAGVKKDAFCAMSHPEWLLVPLAIQAMQPNSDLVRGKDFEAFSEW